MTTEKSAPIVVTLKLKSGYDLLAFYGGEGEESDTIGRSIIVYRPIWIKEVMTSYKDQYVPKYLSDFYSNYGGPLVAIPYAHIITRDVASEFYSIYYQKVIGDLLVADEKLQASYRKYFTYLDEKEVMGSTDSFLVHQETEFVQ
jgi:hypothetical protein